MGNIVGNVSSNVVQTTAQTLTTTNTGFSVAVNSGVKVIRVKSGTSVYGGGSANKSGISINGNAKAIVLHEGGNIVGGPGATSTNYAGTGGTGGTAIESNATVKYVKTYGNVVGGGGGGGGPGKRGLHGNWNAYPNWSSQFDFNVTMYEIYSANIMNPSYPTNSYKSTISNFYNSLVGSGSNYNNGSDGTDGNSGTQGAPGSAGNSGNIGNNATSPYENINYNQGAGYFYKLLTNTYSQYPGGYFMYPHIRFYLGYANRSVWLSRRFYNSLINNGNLAYTYNYLLYKNSVRSSTGSANQQWAYRDINSKNSNTARGSVGAGGQPGNKFNTTNTKTPFGS